jgi:hypothetical protein
VPARVVAAGIAGVVALERQQDPPALLGIPRDVADVVVALAEVHLGRDDVGVPSRLLERAVGAVEADVDAVEVEAGGGVDGHALVVDERQGRGAADRPAPRVGGVRSGRQPDRRRGEHGCHPSPAHRAKLVIARGRSTLDG